MRERQDELDAAGIAVAVVTFDHGPLAEAYVKDSGLEWPFLLDQERALYQACGMLRANAWHIYGPASLWAYAKLLAKGRKIPQAGSDVHQRGGDVLVDPEGTVRLHHVGSGPADRPTVDTILAAVRAGGTG